MLLLWLAALAPTQAQETVTLHDLVVWTRDGAKNVFELKNDPRVVFEEGALVVRAADGTEFRFAVSDLLRWTYQQRTIDGIDDASADKTHPFMEGDHLVISQLKEGTIVRVYATDGRQVLQRQMKRDGACRIPLQKLPTGVYVVQVNTLTYKILKK
jgi:hypothetical protein